MTLKNRTRKKKAKTKVTLIIWYDAVAETGWIGTEEAKRTCKLAECVSIGHVVDRNNFMFYFNCNSC